MKLIKGALLLTLIVLISVSLTSGLELSASTGGNDGSSSTSVSYGATVEDYANQHIKLNPGDGTLSNAFSGTGNLPSSSIGISDTKGNYAYVSRSVSGKPVTTKWNYDWNTYKPTSSTAGSGVGAWLSLTASNAYSITGSGYASNSEGDSASTSTTVGSGSSSATASLSNYYVNPYAFTNEADAYQSYNSASGNTIQSSEYANNYEGDSIVRWYTNPLSDIENGKITSYVGSAKAQKYSVIDSVSIGSLSGNVLYKGLGARNKVGDNVIEGVRFPVASSSNSIKNYKATVYADSAKATGTLKADASGNAIMGGTAFYSDRLYDDSFINLQSGSLTGYSNAITSTTTMATISQGITSTSSGSSIWTNPYASNKEGDSSRTTTEITKGQLSGYSDTATATLTSAQTKANIISVQGSRIVARSDAENGIIHSGVMSDIQNGNIKGYATSATAKNEVWPPKTSVDSCQEFTSASGTSLYFSGNAYKELEGLSGLDYYATTNLNIIVGSVKGYKISAITALSPQGPKIFDSATTSQNMASASGAYAEMNSHAQNRARASDADSYLFNGQADFKAIKTNNAAFTNILVNTQSTLKLLDIRATGFSKTALMLEPFKWKMGDLFGTVGSLLVNKGYAVTDYSNAGVTWDKVSKLDESTVSMITTHGVVDDLTKTNPNTIGLAISYDPYGTGAGTQKSWTQLQPDLKTTNGMIIVDACDPFNKNSYTTPFTDGTKTTTPGKYTVSKAEVSGGFIGPMWYPGTNTVFMKTFFERLCAGDTVYTANVAATKSVNQKQTLTLQGNHAYKLK